MADMDLVFPSWQQHERMTAALEAIALNGGSTSIDTLAAACKGIIDGTNTTRVFWDFLPRALAAGESDRYKILSRFATAAAQAWNDKTYTLRSHMASVSSSSTMEPLDDLKGKKAGQLCTENTEPIEDWTDEDPMTWYIRANAKSKEDGTMDIKFFEGEEGFDISGEDAPVWTFALTLWIKEWDDGTYNYISFRTTKAAGYEPDAGDVAPDNKKRPITWHATFPGGLNSKGALTSGAGIKAYNFASATTGISKARQMDIYEGLWNDCDTRYLLRMWQLRHWNLENSNIAEGCTTYNHQFLVAAGEENVKRVLLSDTQAANFVVGSTVSVGDTAGNSNHDRGQAHMRNLADLVKIASIEKVQVEETQYTALNLEMENPMTTTAQTYVSTMPWHSGATEVLPGRKDGCPNNLTNGKSPLRCAGIEVLDGAYAVGLDPLYQVTANEAGGFDYNIYECRDSQKQAGSITGDYVDTTLTVKGITSGWNYVKEFIRTKLGVLFPKTFGGASTTYYKSAFYGSGGAGVRCPWRFANLNNGGNAGLAAENGNNSPGNANWNSRPRVDRVEGGRKSADMHHCIPAQAKISKTGNRENGMRRRGRRMRQVVTSRILL